MCFTGLYYTKKGKMSMPYIPDYEQSCFAEFLSMPPAARAGAALIYGTDSDPIIFTSAGSVADALLACGYKAPKVDGDAFMLFGCPDLGEPLRLYYGKEGKPLGMAVCRME